MKYKKILSIACVSVLAIFISNCGEGAAGESGKTGESKEMSEADMVKHGKYMVSIMGCNDCHSPKIFSQNAPPMVDTNRALSGHPEGQPIDLSALPASLVGSMQWVFANPSFTAVVIPGIGVSYSANITSDPETGIGNWEFEQFSKAFRGGKYHGNPGGRALRPPMPWMEFSHMTDADAKAIFHYLKSVKPVKNLPPLPVEFPEALAMMAK